MYTEAWHIHTACVHLSFTKTDQYQDTLRPDDFVEDFPLHLWLFLPRERRGEDEGANFNSQGVLRDIHRTPTRSVGGQPTQAMGDFKIEGTSQSHEPKNFDPLPAQNFDSLPRNLGPLPQNLDPLHLRTPSKSGTERPLISFIAHVPDPIRAKLERLQFLFLLRLKDSFNDLKNAALKFLTLVALGNDKKSPAELTSPTTPLLGNRHDTLVSREECESSEEVTREFGDEVTERETDVNTRQPAEGEVQRSNTTTSEPVPNGKSESASIAGCVIVRSVRADILLPTIFSEKTRGVPASGKNTPINSPLSPSPLPDLTQLPESTATRLLSPSRPTSSSPSPLAPHTLTHPPDQHTVTHTLGTQPQPSITGSQSSLLSQTSSTSQTSFQALVTQSQAASGAGLTGQSGLTGSQTSLPILFDGGQRSSGDDVISLRGYRQSTLETHQLTLKVCTCSYTACIAGKFCR